MVVSRVDGNDLIGIRMGFGEETALEVGQGSCLKNGGVQVVYLQRLVVVRYSRAKLPNLDGSVAFLQERFHLLEDTEVSISV